ncbi:MAG: glucose-6-phosphate dehydrogenase [Ignavibacteria bacterium]|nr:glucose-6-phosphate dehydrogenase [Ignavibacteria bacterium]MCU7501858.1 glucose-6-phosphate dehydrogenase [Ignavibacteria bacterium]MCU7514796.1 glucose-6-phosphate dehydrogenase [Ignavibacteria bacterium]
MEKPENCIIVIFGASGDLTKRKLIPALYKLFEHDLLPERFAILGVARTELTDKKFRDAVFQFTGSGESNNELRERFKRHLNYIHLKDYSPAEFAGLNKKLKSLDAELETGGNCIYYLATPPGAFEDIVLSLGVEKMQFQGENNWKRLIIEKPFGNSLESAKELNRRLCRIFNENQIYRIDHYLGKETVQNIFVTRFSNGIFEPLWNRNYVHHVEITAAESEGIGSRGGYYDQSGALRDMVQNHLLQVLGLIAKEPPSSIRSEAVRDEKLKVFESLRIMKPEDVESHVIRGQYVANKIGREIVAGYREEMGVERESHTETYVAIKLFIDNWRWGGVPFYLRTGKRMPAAVTEAVIHFRPTPHSLFRGMDGSLNQLVIRIQPDEGMLLKISMKVPGRGYNVQEINMDFHYSELAGQYVPGAYERLLLDAIEGDTTLYARGDAVEACWNFIQPIVDAWQKYPGIKLFGYPAGTWGPENADDLIEESGLTWRYPCRNLSGEGSYCEL